MTNPAPHQQAVFESLGKGSTEVWETLVSWRAAGRSFALLTVVDSRGFTPQKPSAHMLVARDGETFGTIGGGALEYDVIREATNLLEHDGRSILVRRHLTQELGMCCGGEMSVFVEVVAGAPRLFLFGAGYIAKPLAALAAGCGFRVTVVDERPEWADPRRFSVAEVLCRGPEEFLRNLDLTSEDYVVVVTHDHALDQRLVQGLLRRPLKFLGMIGSLPKQRKFALRLRARGFSDQEIARLHTPLGVPVGALGPEEIAVSVMAEIIGVRRGAQVRSGWVPPIRRAVGQAAVPGSEAPGSSTRDSALPDPAVPDTGVAAAEPMKSDEMTQAREVTSR